MDGRSLHLTAEKITQLRTLFPELFSDGKLDLARLRELFGEGGVIVAGEHYELNWLGKSKARQEIQIQSTATLIPDQQFPLPEVETRSFRKNFATKRSLPLADLHKAPGIAAAFMRG